MIKTFFKSSSFPPKIAIVMISRFFSFPCAALFVFFPVLLIYKWHMRLCKFKVYHVFICYALWNYALCIIMHIRDMQLLHVHCEIITIMRLLNTYITSHNYHFERFFFFFACVVKNIENPIFNIIQIYNKVLLPIAITLYIRFTEHNHFITGSLYL